MGNVRRRGIFGKDMPLLVGFKGSQGIKIGHWTHAGLTQPLPSLALSGLGLPALQRTGHPALKKDRSTPHRRCAPHLGNTLELTLRSRMQVSQPQGLESRKADPVPSLSAVW